MKKITRSFVVAGLLALATSVNAQEHVWKYVATGDASTYAIRDDGTLWSCGWNEKGQLGVPAVSERTAEWQCVGTDTDWKKAIGGKAYAFFIKEDGSLWAAGTSESGVQGTGDGIDHKELVRVGTDNDWVDVAVSHFWGYSAIGLKQDGTIWGWGQNTSYQLGLGDRDTRTTPVQIGTDTDWKQVSLGSSHCVALKQDGTIWGWGQNTSGQLGLGNSTSQSSPVQIGTENDWVYVKAIDNRTYAVKADGTLWATGDNYSNLLGFNQADDELVALYYEFTKVTTIPDGVISVSGCENTTTIAVGNDGVITQIYALGSNSDGALGDGNGKLMTATSSSDEMPFSAKPVNPLLPAGQTYSMLASGQNYSFVLTTDGKFYAWGRNKGGQLGDGSEKEQLQTSYQKKPIEIACPGGATPGGDDEDVVTVASDDIPSDLKKAAEIKLTGTWNTSKFTELAQAIGTTAFGASNTILVSVDMSEALIEEGTNLYVQGGLSKNGVFVNCKALEKVVMPAAAEATNFKDFTNAFMNCEKLTEIDLQNCSGLTTLNSAFMGCSSLKKINFVNSKSLTGVSSMASTFKNCTSLTDVVLPEEIAFASGTFAECTALANIDWTSYTKSSAPIFYSGMFDGISDLKAITLTVDEKVYDVFAADANWSKLNLVSKGSTGINGVENGASVRFDGNTLYTSQPVNDVCVYTVSGSLVRKCGVVATSLNLSDVANGAYILVYTQNGQKHAVKVVKK
ncbi:leucine-rich repeat protein [uncultured Prevotella sp.]|uniref:RCC1 domain-containing protein n=1 Tax=uncultured Prevotella sp. TaxID=159272 RepID=UPI002623BDEC|nr:leucine-rich repeat protein [uncultured Prevotella sp.]